MPAVAGALGLPGAVARAAQLDAVLAHLRDRQLLLILDTCEHLIDACAMFAEAVIARAPRVTLLATSREPLDVSGENACPVAPLPVPGLTSSTTAGLARYSGADPGARYDGDLGHRARSRAGVLPEDDGTAVELFLQRAAAAVPGFTVTPDDLPDVITVCQRLDGLPLAIELAAVRLRALPLGELASRLDQRLALLTSGQRGGRHRTLRDAIELELRPVHPRRAGDVGAPFRLRRPVHHERGRGGVRRRAGRRPGHADDRPPGGQVGADQDRPGRTRPASPPGT